MSYVFLGAFVSGRVKGGAAGVSGAGSFSLDKKGCLVPGVQKVPTEVLETGV